MNIEMLVATFLRGLGIRERLVGPHLLYSQVEGLGRLAAVHAHERGLYVKRNMGQPHHHESCLIEDRDPTMIANFHS